MHSAGGELEEFRVLATGSDGTRRRDRGSTICDEDNVPSAAYVEARGQMVSVLSDDLSRRAAGGELFCCRVGQPVAAGSRMRLGALAMGNGCWPRGRRRALPRSGDAGRSG